MDSKTTNDPSDNDPPAAFVAIDWADSKHDIAVLPAGARQPEHLQIEHRPEVLAAWIATLRERFGGAPVAVALEQKRGALIHALLGHDFLVLYPINPSTLAHLRKAFHTSGAKDDPLDRDLILELLLKHRDRLRRWSPDEVATRLLSLLVEDRRQAVNQRTRLGEQLLAALKNYYPALIDLVGGEVTTKLACELILKWPDFASLRRAKNQTVRTFFYARNFRRGDLLETRLQALGRSVALCQDAAVVGAGRLKAVCLARQLLALLPAIASYDKEIAALFAQHEDAPIFAALPGAGPVMAPRLLSVFGSRRERWSSSTEVATYTGVAPVLERSGKHSSVHWRWAAPKFVRQSLHEFAGCSIRCCPWAKDFYQLQRQRGKTHHAAVRSLAFKWVRILYRCWKDHCPYDPSKYAPANVSIT